MTEEQKPEESGKDQKNYDATMKKLIALLGNDSLMKSKKKLPKDDVGSIISELFKEERETLQTEIKSELRELIKKKVEMDRALKAKQDELEKLTKDKQKEFNEAANKLFNKIEGIGEIETSYYDTLNKVGK